MSARERALNIRLTEEEEQSVLRATKESGHRFKSRYGRDIILAASQSAPTIAASPVFEQFRVNGERVMSALRRCACARSADDSGQPPRCREAEVLGTAVRDIENVGKSFLGIGRNRPK